MAMMVPMLPPPMFMAPPGYWLNIPPKQEEPEIEQPEEPEKEVPSTKSLLMKNLIEKGDLSAAARNKKKLNDIEYKYVTDSIQEKIKTV